jgi:hypothetical protein
MSDSLIEADTVPLVNLPHRQLHCSHLHEILYMLMQIGTISHDT